MVTLSGKRQQIGCEGAYVSWMVLQIISSTECFQYSLHVLVSAVIFQHLRYHLNMRFHLDPINAPLIDGILREEEESAMPVSLL